MPRPIRPPPSRAARAHISTLRGGSLSPARLPWSRSGTGKSALARALAPQLAPAPGAVVLRSDAERKTLFGKDEHDKLPEAAYSPAVTARVYATTADKARRALAAGHSAVIDAVFARPQ